MPRRATTTQKRHQAVGGDPQRSQARPDAAVRKAAKKVRDLQAAARQFTPVLPQPRQLAAMSTTKLLAGLAELVRVETFYLSLSMDPRPIEVGKSFTYVHRRWAPGVDPIEQDPNFCSVRQSPENPPPPAALPQPLPGLASGGIEEERAIRAPR